VIAERGRANYLGAQASLPACLGQLVIAGNPAGKDGRRSEDHGRLCPLTPKLSSGTVYE
jgi:hypothetical protein